MDESPPVDNEHVIESLLIALANQAAEANQGRLSRAVLADLAESPRSVVRAILGSAGHLIHYGTAPHQEHLTSLFDQIVSALRHVSPAGPGGVLPGDPVELVVDRPADRLKAGALLRVRYVGEDGTFEVGHESLSDDYRICTVPFTEVRLPEPARK